MTGPFPCVDPDDFDMVDGTHITPRDHMQWRHVARQYASGVDRSLPAADGVAKNIPIHSVEASWTNTSPIPQAVYGLITRGGSSVVVMARSRAYIQTNSGASVGSPAPAPTLDVILSRFGCGAERGLEAFTRPRFMVVENRMGERTSLIGSTATLAPGQSYRVGASLAFISENWEAAAIDGGAAETEARFSSGATQIDLYAYPLL